MVPTRINLKINNDINTEKLETNIIMCNVVHKLFTMINVCTMLIALVIFILFIYNNTQFEQGTLILMTL